MQYKIGICDDEKETCTELENIVLNYYENMLNKVDTYVWNSGNSCCENLRNGSSVDVLFLDIELPGKNGIETGKFIRDKMEDEAIKIIFISSKTNYAMELFQVHPYDFLVKPFTREKVEKLLEKILILEKKDKMRYSYIANGNRYNIEYGEIKYFMSNNKYIEVYLINEEIKSFRGKLKSELPKLPNQFVMIGQSYIINMKYLKECHYDYVVMRDNVVINISQRYRSIFREQLCEYNNSGGIING